MTNKHVEKALDRAAEAIRKVASLADLTENTASGGKFPVTPPIQDALAEETGLVQRGMKHGLPSGWPKGKGSGWDVCLCSPSSDRPAVVAEIKWVPGVPGRDSGQDQIEKLPWDIFKLGQGVEEGAIDRGYMICGASVRWWKNALSGNGPLPQHHRGAKLAALFDGCEALPATDSRWGDLWWKWSSESTRPPAPRAITLSPIRRCRILPLGTENPWELRCVRVTT